LSLKIRRNGMKKLIMLAALLAMALVTTAPALAQVSPVSLDSPVSGVPGKGPETPPDCETLKATGADVNCGVPPAPQEISVPPAPQEIIDTGGDTTGDAAGDTGSNTATSTDTGVVEPPGPGNNTGPVGEPGTGDTSTGAIEEPDTGETSTGEDTSTDTAGTGDDTAEETGKDGVAGTKDRKADKEVVLDTDDDSDDDSDDTAGHEGDPEQDQEADSGDVDQSVNIINTGDNVNMCIGVLQAANTGNSQNQQGVSQDDSEADEVELEGGSRITITPQLIVDCRQTIMQIVMAGQSETGSKGVGREKAANLSRAAQLLRQPVATPKVVSASNVGQPKAALRSLPRTGGIPVEYAALFGLGAGSLLIAGGLLARRMFR